MCYIENIGGSNRKRNWITEMYLVVTKPCVRISKIIIAGVQLLWIHLAESIFQICKKKKVKFSPKRGANFPNSTNTKHRKCHKILASNSVLNSPKPPPECPIVLWPPYYHLAKILFQFPFKSIAFLSEFTIKFMTQFLSYLIPINLPFVTFKNHPSLSISSPVYGFPIQKHWIFTLHPPLQGGPFILQPDIKKNAEIPKNISMREINGTVGNTHPTYTHNNLPLHSAQQYSRCHRLRRICITIWKIKRNSVPTYWDSSRANLLSKAGQNSNSQTGNHTPLQEHAHTSMLAFHCSDESQLEQYFATQSHA